MIDSHVHFWQLSRGDYTYPTKEMAILYQDYLPEHLQHQLNEYGIHGAVAVQATNTIEETHYLLELASIHSWINGIIGWLDIASGDFADDFDSLRKNRKFKGIRIHLHHINMDDVHTRKRLLTNLSIIADYGYAIDVLLSFTQLPKLKILVEELSDLKILIDHLAFPNVKGNNMEPWKAEITEWAVYPNVCCKLSGMLLMSGETPERIKPYVKHLMDTFGSKRLLYGSDWPVSLQGGSYGEVVRLFNQSLPDNLSEIELDNICHDNAVRFYNL